MTNFSSFFPAAGGGGGFTKMKKYSTSRALNDATDKVPPATFYGRQFTNLAIGATGFTNFQLTTPSGYQSSANEIVGGTFVHNGQTHTIATNTAYDVNTGAGISLTFTPGLTATMAAFSYVTITNPTFLTVNPATDLGLSDGDSIGYFMVGAGDTTSSGTLGAMGGKIIQGTKIISNASTDLVITPAVGANTASTISGGLTITTADGSNRSGSANYNGGSYDTTLGYGINGYGQGALGTNVGGFAEQTSPTHGFGSGTSGSTASDGAILIFY
jgi:hypothetical protein